VRRPLRVLLAVVVAVLPVLVVALADLPFVPAAEARLEHQTGTAAKAASVEVEIGTFPVVGRALLLGEVASVEITWFGVKVGAIRATSLRLELNGVGFDRGALLGGEARITGVESGEIRVLIAPSQLGRLFDRDVFVEAGEVRLRLTPDTVVDVEVSATNRGLVLAAAGVAPVTAELGSDIPCAPSVEVERSDLSLHCSFRGLPPMLHGRITAPA